VGGAIFLDPSEEEEERQASSLQVAMMPQFGEITKMSQLGVSELKTVTDMTSQCLAGCIEVHKVMRQHFLDRAAAQQKTAAEKASS